MFQVILGNEVQPQDCIPFQWLRVSGTMDSETLQECWRVSLGSWFLLSYSSWQVSFLLPIFPLGSYFYNRSASVFLPFLCCFRSCWVHFWDCLIPPSERTWLELFCSLSASWAFERRLWPFLHLLRSTLRRLWMSAQVGSCFWKISLTRFKNPTEYSFSPCLIVTFPILQIRKGKNETCSGWATLSPSGTCLKESTFPGGLLDPGW